MSEPKEPEDVKLICSIFSPERALLTKVIEEDLRERFGEVEWVSPELFFDKSKYYEKEMGWPLYRRFISFKDLIKPDAIVSIKLATNEIERKYSVEGRRRVNIDPGYISLEKLVLVTGKNYAHRIYLNSGIYAEVTLIYKNKTYTPLSWTYPDYAEKEIIEYFNEIRRRYKEQLRKRRC